MCEVTNVLLEFRDVSYLLNVRREWCVGDIVSVTRLAPRRHVLLIHLSHHVINVQLSAQTQPQHVKVTAPIHHISKVHTLLKCIGSGLRRR